MFSMFFTRLSCERKVCEKMRAGDGKSGFFCFYTIPWSWCPSHPDVSCQCFFSSFFKYLKVLKFWFPFGQHSKLSLLFLKVSCMRRFLITIVKRNIHFIYFIQVIICCPVCVCVRVLTICLLFLVMSFKHKLTWCAHYVCCLFKCVSQQVFELDQKMFEFRKD